MLDIDKNTKQINLTRGDFAPLEITGKNEDETPYTFKKGEVVRIKVFKSKDCNCVELQKDAIIMEEMEKVNIPLTKEETKLGEIINKPTKYWYEVELNPEDKPQTIIAYDKDGEKTFMLYPEGADKR